MAMFAFDPSDSHFLPSAEMSIKSTVEASIARQSAMLQDVLVDAETPHHEDSEETALGQPRNQARTSEPVKRSIRSVEQIPEGAMLIGNALEIRSRANGTPPIDIIVAPRADRSSGGAEIGNGGEVALPDPTPRPLNSNGRGARKKKRAHKKGAVATLSMVGGPTPGTSGDEDSDFSSTSIFRKRDLSAPRSISVTSSPGLRPSTPSSGISALTKQLEALECSPSFRTPSMARSKSKLGSPAKCDQSFQQQPYYEPRVPLFGPLFRSPTPSSESVTSGTMSDEESSAMTSYEVPLEHDFISSDVAGKDLNELGENATSENVFRKMSASDFEPLRCLGKGTYGTVLLVKQESTGKLYAQKQFRKASLTVQKQLVEQTKTERVILESINRHPFVVKLFYAFQDHEKLYLILEYAQGGELFTRMLTERMFPEDTAAFYMAEMVLALEHLHHNVGVVYRDLKPENCLLDAEGHLLLTDFGLSKVAVDGEHRCRSMTGTLEYMAPEVILQQSYGTAVDWWSFGILGFDLLTGSSPFRANNDAKVREKILKSKLALPYFLSADAKDLLTRLLRKEPKKRLGASMPKDMHAIKNHRFFRKIDWKALEKRELEPPIKPLVTDPELAENFSTNFTDLALSPVVDRPRRDWGMDSEIDQFGGFSFVASRSLFESGDGFFGL